MSSSHDTVSGSRTDEIDTNKSSLKTGEPVPSSDNHENTPQQQNKIVSLDAVTTMYTQANSEFSEP